MLIGEGACKLNQGETNGIDLVDDWGAWRCDFDLRQVHVLAQ